MWGGFFQRSLFDAQEILDGVWLGSYDAARAPLSEFESRNIAFVLTVGDDELEPVHLKSGVTYCICRCEDEAATSLLPNFALFHEFIQFARDRNKSVLIHCMAGISRSTTTLVSFMMKMDSIDFETALARVRQHRRFVCPNTGFERQLRAYEHVTIGSEAARENFDKFRVKPAPKVVVARHQSVRTVAEPSLVRGFLDELLAIVTDGVAAAVDSTAASSSAAAPAAAPAADQSGAVEWIGDEPADDNGVQVAAAEQQD